MGTGAGSWLPLDTTVVGLGRRWISLPCRLLGTAHRLLWRDLLRIWLLRRWLWRWTLGQWSLLLQPFGHERERNQYSQRLQHHGCSQHHGEPSQLQRRQRWHHCTSYA